jgi:hypothetical protein
MSTEKLPVGRQNDGILKDGKASSAGKNKLIFSQRIGLGMSGGRMIKEPMIVANRMIEEISK